MATREQDRATQAARPLRSGARPDNWLASETGRTDPGSEAWSLMHWLMITNKHRFMAMGQEFDLAPQQMIALRMLGGGPRPMGELAGSSSATARTSPASPTGSRSGAWCAARPRRATAG